MNLWRYEWRLLLRSRIPVIGLLVLTALNVASLVSGVQRIDSQREAIARIAALQAADLAAVAAAHGDSTDAGQAAYYSFHPTWNPPSALSFAAVGMRDVAPFTVHLHVADARGVDGEGLQIGDGEIDFLALGRLLAGSAPTASFIPEVWQGHKDEGRGFWTAIGRLEHMEF